MIQACRLHVTPSPVADFRQVFEMLSRVSLVPVQHLLTPFRQRPCLGVIGSPQGFHAQVKAAHLVENDHVERGGCRPFVDESAHVKASRIGTPMDDLVDRSLVAVEGKYDRLGFGK